MSDRYSALIVILENNIRDDDAEALISAMKQLRGVLDVQPHIANPEEAIAETRVRADLLRRIIEMIKSP